MAAVPGIDRPAHDRVRTGRRAAIGDVLILCAVALASVSLFLPGWVHLRVQFDARNSSAGVLQHLTADVETQITAIADSEVRAATAPTMWQDHSHIFQVLFALLLLIAVIIVIAPLIPARWHVRTRGGACLIGIAAAVVVAIAVLHIAAQRDALPGRISATIGRNALLKQSLALTNSTPHVSGGPGWPVLLTAVGVALALLGTLTRFIVAVRDGKYAEKK